MLRACLTLYPLLPLEMSRASAGDDKHDDASAGTSSVANCRVLLLVGLPGCGKSTLARSLQPHWHWLDSDTAKLDDLIVAANKLLRHGQRVTIDRCNITRDERAHTLQQLHKGTNIDCVWFDVAETTCLSRVLNRQGHATLTQAKMQRKGELYVKRLISGVAQHLQPPVQGEGYRALHTINDDISLLALFDALIAVVPSAARKPICLDDGSSLSAEFTQSLSPSPSQHANATATHLPIIKFPRTPHLFSTGATAVSTDDLLVSPAQSARFVGPNASIVVVQEKVDGANLGFTLLPDWSIAVQNRSHYVTASSHAQFSLLPQWMEQHSAELIQALLPPGRYTVGSLSIHPLQALIVPQAELRLYAICLCACYVQYRSAVR